MYTIVLASQKGGSGKTTLSGHLAVEADKAGAGPVAMIDTDPQGSLSHWWNARSKETPLFAHVGMLELGDALENLRQSGIKIAIIDTPPAITAQISQVVAHADLVVVPTRPSPHDLRAVGATVDIAERHGKPLIFVVNGATARARITGEAAVALSQHGTVAPVTLHHRVDFAASMVDGRTVGEVVAKSPSAKEVRDLWLYVQDRLSRIVHDPKMAPAEKPAELAVSALSRLDESEATVVEEAPAIAEAPVLPLHVPSPLPTVVAALPVVEAVEPPPLIEPEPMVEDLPPVRPSVFVAPEADIDDFDDYDYMDDIPETSSEPPPFVITKDYQGPDRRSGEERRDFNRPIHYGPSDKRVHTFGRRATDRAPAAMRPGLGNGLNK
ncbi:MAG TPA: ParA family protein [Rhizomicrobium sp.]|jgi:chromosome partitioning protein|nr:ParA family protein [Rhizomicrobium sp.]